MAGTAPRAAAFEILRAVRRGTPFAAARDPAVAGLDDPDRRLAHELAAGVLRHRRELDAQLVPLLTADWRHVDAGLKDVLRLGAYQLTLLTRVPAYAAVQTTVDLAKRVCGTKPAGLVNAVLRRLAAHGDELDANAQQPPLAQRYSHPTWLVDRWVARFGTERTEALLAHNNRPPRLTVQPVRWSTNALRAAFTRRRIRVQSAPDGDGLTVTGVRVRELPGYPDGGFIVQDAAQVRVLRFAAIPDGATVWDTCAAPGGKATVLAKRCRVLASDVRRDRIERLLATVRRAAPTVTVFQADARTPPLHQGSVDAILVDAPCSATGAMARHPDARWRLSPDHIQQLARLQADILDGSAPILRPNGLLVYVTCSLEAEENHEQVERFLEQHPEYTRAGEDLYIFPPDAGTDGGFAARLRRAT